MATTYLFEGQQRTVSEIRSMVPALCDAAIRRHLKRGTATRAAMLSYNSPQRKAHNAKLASREYRRVGWFQSRSAV